MAADLSCFLLIDASTGTVLTADTCYLVSDDAFTDEEWEDLEGSDSDVCELGKLKGKKLSDVVTLRPILPGETF